MSTPSRELAPLIAIVGCDGSGKSTVSAHLTEWMRRYGPAAAAHLGKQSGNVGRALGRLPLIGHWFQRTIKRKSTSVHEHFADHTAPGLLTALVISLFTLRRQYRFRRMLALRRRGCIIVTDRYPQTALPGAYDGPGLPAGARGSFLVRWLARREHAVFAWMAGYPPDLVLRLNVDLDTACARKPDHSREALARKIAATPRLSYNGAPIVDVDATRPLAEVVAAAEAAVADVMARLGHAPARPPSAPIAAG